MLLIHNQISKAMSFKEPLVSIVVITYHSSKFIEETLNSIYNQTYPNIELIITDDCSKDNTIEICKNWLEKHPDRFIHSTIITSETNQGIPANCNKGYDIAQGEWIKAIAGDDCLYPHAIEKYMEAAKEHDFSICFSSMDVYKNTFQQENIIIPHWSPIPNIRYNLTTAEEQFKLLTITNQIFAPAVIMKKELYHEVGKYDEEIKLCEDWPMWLKITRKGYRFHYIDEPLVMYRKYIDSTWGQQTYNKKYAVTNEEVTIKQKYIFPYIGCFKKWIFKLDYYARINLNLMSRDNNSSIKIITFKIIKRFCEKYIRFLYKWYDIKLKNRIKSQV